MMGTICTQPAGARSRQRLLVFSPHPDDDVISMGGTLIRLVEQGHKVHVAYMTSGNIAVFDHDAWRFTDFVVRLQPPLRPRQRALRGRQGTRAGLPERQEAGPARLAKTC